MLAMPNPWIVYFAYPHARRCSVYYEPVSFIQTRFLPRFIGPWQIRWFWKRIRPAIYLAPDNWSILRSKCSIRNPPIVTPVAVNDSLNFTRFGIQWAPSLCVPIFKMTHLSLKIITFVSSTDDTLTILLRRKSINILGNIFVKEEERIKGKRKY